MNHLGVRGGGVPPSLARGLGCGSRVPTLHGGDHSDTAVLGTAIPFQAPSRVNKKI